MVAVSIFLPPGGIEDLIVVCLRLWFLILMSNLDFPMSLIFHNFIIIIRRRVKSALAQLKLLQCRPFLHQTCLQLSFRLNLLLVKLVRSLHADSFLRRSFNSRVSIGGEVLFEVFLRECIVKLRGLQCWHVFFYLS